MLVGRRAPKLAHVPVIAVTGHVTRGAIERALQAGCATYLLKSKVARGPRGRRARAASGG